MLSCMTVKLLLHLCPFWSIRFRSGKAACCWLAAAQVRPKVWTALVVWSPALTEGPGSKPGSTGLAGVDYRWLRERNGSARTHLVTKAHVARPSKKQKKTKCKPGSSGDQLRGCTRAGCGRCPLSVLTTAGANSRRTVDGALRAGDADEEGQDYRAAWWHC